MQNVRFVAGALCALVLGACDTPSRFTLRDADASVGLPDADATTSEMGVPDADSGTPDMGTPDTGGHDTGVHDGGWPANEGTCATPVNINARGLSAGGGVTTLHGNNFAGPQDAMPSPQTPTTCTNSGVVTFNASYFLYETVFSYTMATAARLEASTAVTGTTPTFDTLLFISSACSASVAPLVCDDDATGLDGGMVPQSTATTASLAAGTTVYIVVAGYTHLPTDPYQDQGEFTLQVSEIP